MNKNTTLIAALLFTLGLAAAPAEAQGRGQQDRARGEQKRQDDRKQRGAEDDRRYDDGWNTPARGNGSGRVPPGWCIGAGNPHNTPENCGYSQSDTRGQQQRGSRGGSYEQAHADFHRELDTRYSRLSSQRPLDVQYQLELRARKRAEHDNWHRRTGIAHE
jgi:hypothetical protein